MSFYNVRLLVNGFQFHCNDNKYLLNRSQYIQFKEIFQISNLSLHRYDVDSERYKAFTYKETILK